MKKLANTAKRLHPTETTLDVVCTVQPRSATSTHWCLSIYNSHTRRTGHFYRGAEPSIFVRKKIFRQRQKKTSQNSIMLSPSWNCLDCRPMEFTFKSALPDPPNLKIKTVSKKPDFRHFISLDGMNSGFFV